MASRLVNLVVHNVSAVGKPANRRKFLIVKSADPKEENGVGNLKKDAMTFDDAMVSRRLYKVYCEMGEMYGALCESMESIRTSDEPNKGASIKKALEDFVKSMSDALPELAAKVSTGGEEGEEEEYEEELEMEKSGKKISKTRMEKLKTLQKVLSEIITEGEKDMEKSVDANVLTKLGQGMAALFGRALGAPEAEIKKFEAAASGVQEPEIAPEVKERLEKSETAAEELRKSNEELSKTVAALQEQAELRKFAEEVAGYKDIGLDPAKDAALLKSVTEKLPKEHADRVREILKSALAQKQASALFSEVGSSGASPTAGSAAEEVLIKTTSKLTELRKSSDGVTEEQARDLVFRENPGLYDRWSKETSVRV